MFFCFYYFFLIKNNRNGRRRERICKKKKKKSKKYITNLLGVEPLFFLLLPPVIVFVSMPSEPEPHLKFERGGAGGGGGGGGGWGGGCLYKRSQAQALSRSYTVDIVVTNLWQHVHTVSQSVPQDLRSRIQYNRMTTKLSMYSYNHITNPPVFKPDSKKMYEYKHYYSGYIIFQAPRWCWWYKRPFSSTNLQSRQRPPSISHSHTHPPTSQAPFPEHFDKPGLHSAVQIQSWWVIPLPRIVSYTPHVASQPIS